MTGSRIALVTGEDLPDYGDDVRPMTPSEAVAKMLWLVAAEPEPPTGGFYSEGAVVGW